MRIGVTLPSWSALSAFWSARNRRATYRTVQAWSRHHEISTMRSRAVRQRPLAWSLATTASAGVDALAWLPTAPTRSVDDGSFRRHSDQSGKYLGSRSMVAHSLIRHYPTRWSSRARSKQPIQALPSAVQRRPTIFSSLAAAITTTNDLIWTSCAFEQVRQANVARPHRRLSKPPRIRLFTVIV